MKLELTKNDIINLLRVYYQKYENRNVKIIGTSNNKFVLTSEVCIGYIKEFREEVDVLPKLNVIMEDLNYNIDSLDIKICSDGNVVYYAKTSKIGRSR